MKCFCSVKDPVKRTKREATAWEKIFANHIFGKGYYLGYMRNSQNSTVKTQSR